MTSAEAIAALSPDGRAAYEFLDGADLGQRVSFADGTPVAGRPIFRRVAGGSYLQEGNPRVGGGLKLPALTLANMAQRWPMIRMDVVPASPEEREQDAAIRGISEDVLLAQRLRAAGALRP